jgi:hypothetical protein
MGYRWARHRWIYQSSLTGQTSPAPNGWSIGQASFFLDYPKFKQFYPALVSKGNPGYPMGGVPKYLVFHRQIYDQA